MLVLRHSYGNKEALAYLWSCWSITCKRWQLVRWRGFSTYFSAVNGHSSILKGYQFKSAWFFYSHIKKIWYGWIGRFAILSHKKDRKKSNNRYLNVDIYFFGTRGKVRHIFTYASWSGTWSTRSRNTSSWGPISWSSWKRTSRTTRSSSSPWWVVGSVCGRKVNHR